MDKKYPDFKNRAVVYKEAMPTQVHGGNSTVQTFLALAKAHAILDFFLSYNNYNYYDFIGVYPITTHCFIRSALNLDKTYKITKDTIKNYVIDLYGLKSDLSYDEYDSVLLAEVFCAVKWNKDIDTQIKELKKKQKELKMQKNKE